MLTKWGAALGLASAGRIASGGGGNTGVPLGPVLNWAALPASAQDEAFAVVLNLGPTNSYGLATYNASAGQWQLQLGYFETLADLNAFTDPKALTAVAAVGPSLDEPDSIRYQWDDPNVQWLRTPDPVPFAWDITDLTNIDPSGIGATQIGDFARYTNPTTGAVAVYRLRSVPAVGSINLTVWVPASIYGEAGLTIRGYLFGTEAMPASGGTIQGYTVTTSGASASVTTSGGEVVLACTSAGHFANIKSTYALTEDDRVYVRLNLRLSQAAAVNVSFYHLLYDNGTSKSQFITTQNPTLPSGNAGKYLATTAAIGLIGSTNMVRSAGTPITNTAELVEILADGTLEAGSPPNPNFMVNVSRNARPYFSMRRRAQTGTETGQHLLQVLSGAAGAQTASFSYLYFMTY
jgi:hypothetical protein